jgi:AraC-like DNA-binding protein
VDIGAERQEKRQNATESGVAGTLSTIYLRGLRDYLTQRELDVAAFLGGYGLDTECLEDASRRIPLSDYDSMLERAGELAGDEHVGIHIGEFIKPAHYGVLGYSVMSCKTALEVFERHMRYEHLVSSRAISTYHFEGDQIRLTWDTRGVQVGRHVAEENLTAVLTYLRWITGQVPKTTRISFVHAAPADLSEHERVFACPIEFGRPDVEVVFPASYTELPIIQHDPVMQKMMDAYAEKMLAELSDGNSLLGEVRSLMVEALDGGGVSLETIAEKLSVTPRTLQRRLSDQGTSFKNVLDEVRKGLALSYITQPFIDLAELGYLLGFSDQTAFQRAFKKWTGTTPGKYKKNNQ